MCYIAIYMEAQLKHVHVVPMCSVTINIINIITHISKTGGHLPWLNGCKLPNHVFTESLLFYRCITPYVVVD
jgi:hypothetical protein